MAEFSNLLGYDVKDAKARESIEKLKEYITPEMYGAIGDGVTDDTSAFELFLNANGVHYLTDGAIYNISHIETDKDIIIYGNGATLKKVGASDTQPMLKLTGDYVEITGVKFDKATEAPSCTLFRFAGDTVILNNCHFYKGSNTKGGWCTDLSADKIMIDNCVFDTQKSVETSDGIHIRKCNSATISNCYVNTKDDCIALYVQQLSDNDVYGDIDNVVITNCVLIANEYSAVKIGQKPTMSVNIGHVLVSNSIITNSARVFTLLDENTSSQMHPSISFDNCKIYNLPAKSTGAIWLNDGYLCDLYMTDCVMDFSNLTASVFGVKKAGKLLIHNSEIDCPATAALMYAGSETQANVEVSNCDITFHGYNLAYTNNFASFVAKNNHFKGTGNALNISNSVLSIIKDNIADGCVIQANGANVYLLFNETVNGGSISSNTNAFRIGTENVLHKTTVGAGTITPDKVITVNIGGTKYKIPAVTV